MTPQVITTDTACCLTDSHEAVVVANKDRHGAPLQTVISTASGLVFTDPRPTEEDLRVFYEHEYRKQYKQTATPKLKHILRAGRLAQTRLKRLREHTPDGSRVLDIGAGGGEFLHACRAAGYDAQGVEPNQGYAEFGAQQYGLKIFNGFYQDAPLDDGGFDAVTMFHVLEHLPQPVEAIRFLAGKLKVGGRLMIEVPNVENTETAPNQKWHLGHLYNFSEKTLAAAGARAGMELAWSGSPDGNLTAIFRKPSESMAPLPIDAILEGSYEQTLALLQRHTMTRHYLRLHVPLSRFARKMSRALNEKRVVRAYQDKPSAELLDDLTERRIA